MLSYKSKMIPLLKDKIEVSFGHSHSSYHSFPELMESNEEQTSAEIQPHRERLKISVIFSMILTGVVLSLQAPFFPKEARKKGLSPSEYSFIFGSYALSALIVGLKAANLANRWGPKAMLLFGILILGLSAITFGNGNLLEDRNYFLGLCVVCRAVDGIGQTFVNVGGTTIISILLPVSSSTLNWPEVAFGIGAVLGPAMGGALFDVGGYLLPFEFVGGILLLMLPVCYWQIPCDKHISFRPGNNSWKLNALLRCLSVWVGMASLAATMVTMGFLSVTLEHHLKKFKLSGLILGLVFLTMGLCFTISCIIWTKVCEKYLKAEAYIVLSSLLVITGFAFLGPLPWIPLHRSLNLIIPSLSIMGIGLAGQNVSALENIKFWCMEVGLPNTTDTSTLVFSIFLFSLNLGGIIGPIAGGFLYDHFGFSFATMFCISFNLLVSYLSIVTCCISCCCSRSAGGNELFAISSSSTSP